MNARCPFCSISPEPLSDLRMTVRDGWDWRKSDSRWIQRYRCKRCRRRFSSATRNACYRQNKRQINFILSKDFSTNVCRRDIARKFNISRHTVARKLLFLGRRAEHEISEMSRRRPLSHTVEFDDMESFEHTKMKPVSITLCVESKSRWILGLRTSEMPARGPLAERARKKYGERKDRRKEARNFLFEQIKPFILPTALIKSDQHPHYPPDVRKHFPNATHKAFHSRKPRSNGLGELKEGAFDPLFSLNHTAAKNRAKVSALNRKTWNTTKKRECLAAHMLIFALAHNKKLLAEAKKARVRTERTEFSKT